MTTQTKATKGEKEMILTDTIKQGFRPFTEYKEHTLSLFQAVGHTINATQVNGPAVADSNGNVTGAYFLNVWLCRQCYDNLEVSKIKERWER